MKLTNSEKEGEIISVRGNSFGNLFLLLLEKEDRGQTYRSLIINLEAKLNLGLGQQLSKD